MAPPAHPGLLRVPDFGAVHAFTTRSGGVSGGPYRTLNLGLSTGDAPEAVHENRRRVREALGLDPARVAQVHQVHGATVVSARDATPEVEADAIVTDDPAWTLSVSYADCVPVLLYDPVAPAVGAVHAGWRGAVHGVVGATVRSMTRRFGTDPALLWAAIGPAVSGARYQVGPEVVDAFAAAGFDAAHARPDPEVTGRYRYDMPGAVAEALAASGIPTARLRNGGWCTVSDASRFYSHRRDGRRTGRHWALVRLP
ncbi:MAG: peptidoglycan editing factor PgeF [Trueperaceae bacterium]|nr:peptidoglycan editing factor PgeF [Trueperaceae bacterium]